ncbi:MAG: hypothetical protein PVG83_00625 [Acidimicrobiia bacterium]|jgi:hypothetical protein
MSFATTIRGEVSRRALALISAVAMLLSFMAIVAAPAWAHQGTVSWGCDGWSVNLTAYFQGADITVTVDGQVVDNDTNWTSYSNSGSWDDSQSHTLQVVVDAYDDNAQPVHDLGSDGSFSPNWQQGEWSFTVNATQDACTQPPQDVAVTLVGSSCDVNDAGAPTGSIDITIVPGSGATVDVYSDAGMSNLVGSTSSSTTLDDLSPGTYYWTATPADGYQLDGPGSGSVTIDDCTTTVTVDAGVCAVDDQGVPAGTVQVTVDPTSGATVTIYSDAAMTDDVLSTSSGGSFSLAPGTYYWDAEAADGFDNAEPDEGQFTIDPCDVTVSVAGVCVVQQDVGVGEISVQISVDDAATVDVSDADGVIATFTQDGSVNVPQNASYSWEATASDGFILSGTTSGDIDIEDCTPPEESGEIIVEKIVLGEGSQVFEFTFNTTGFTLGDNTLAHGQSSSSGAVAVGDGYSVSETVPTGWTLVSAVCDDGSDPANIDVSADEVVTCTFTNQIEDVVGAAIVVTVGGTCVVDGDDGEGVISVTVSVAGGATVVVTDSDGDIVGTFSDDGSVTVPEGAVYNWSATPSEGFEFPAGFDTTGSVTIETCSTPDTLPFTGIESDPLVKLGFMLLAAGVVIVTGSTYLFGWNEEA